ncbi:hypothetical protein BO99DRAFT_37965 [Aspergillus violaceofuscus CBS 115571]|uniref:Uncharacterized protein n=1 Tax=Aspergillus violaceofuscus (strain CBS 115571) TaxID=1450538 RepID=A0A2V5GSV8_ASPV1|nr:hypothetical protein BO99DRAFT_37965 [Aspergillus violaceofuscus CBS 115571]
MKGSGRGKRQEGMPRALTLNSTARIAIPPPSFTTLSNGFNFIKGQKRALGEISALLAPSEPWKTYFLSSLAKVELAADLHLIAIRDVLFKLLRGSKKGPRHNPRLRSLGRASMDAWRTIWPCVLILPLLLLHLHLLPAPPQASVHPQSI